jgi:hypothetical protein
MAKIIFILSLVIRQTADEGLELMIWTKLSSTTNQLFDQGGAT